MTRTAYVLLLSLGLAACVSVHVSTLSTFASADGRFSVTVPGGAMTDTILPSGGAFAGSTVHALSTTLPDGRGSQSSTAMGSQLPDVKDYGSRSRRGCAGEP